MKQILLTCVTVLTLVASAPLDDGGSDIPYRYEYAVDVAETGDMKSHYEERDESAVVVGSFQVLDPTGDLRKLSYRVEDDSGFVITDMQVMPAFRAPAPDPSTYNNWTPASDLQRGGDGFGSAQGAGGDASAGGGAAGGDGNADEGGAEGEGVDGLVGLSGNDLGSGLGEAGGAGGDGSGGSGGSSVGSAGGSSTGGDASGEDASNAASTASGEAGSSDQGTGSGAVAPPQVQVESSATKVKVPGPAFTYNIVRRENNLFDVQAEIIGHEIRFTAKGGSK